MQPSQKTDWLAQPSPKFRRASWRALQLKLDPLARPHPLPLTAASMATADAR